MAKSGSGIMLKRVGQDAGLVQALRRAEHHVGVAADVDEACVRGIA